MIHLGLLWKPIRINGKDASIHDESHVGVNRTLDTISSKYYWPNLTMDVKEYVSIIAT